MSVKQVKVEIPGSGISAHVGIAPETTAGDVLADIGAQGNVELPRGYVLSPRDGRGFFRAQDRLDPFVRDGDVLSVSPWAKVGSGVALALDAHGLTVLTALAGCALVLLIVLVACWPPQSKDRPPRQGSGADRAAPELWSRLGWRRSGDLYSGQYVLDRFLLPGKVSFGSRWCSDFRVWAPAKLVAACGRHRGCFIPKSKPRSHGWRWFSVHFRRRPSSLSEGILAVQEMLNWGAGRLGEDIA